MAVVLTSVTCASINDPTPPPDKVFSLGEEFELSLGQAAWTADSSVGVRFTGVPTESRCPADVTCVWEGFATVSLAATVMRADYFPELSTTAAVCCTADTVAGFIMAMRALEPVPSSGQRDVPYVARLLVTAAP